MSQPHLTSAPPFLLLRGAITEKVTLQTHTYESVSSKALHRLQTQRCATRRHPDERYYCRFSSSATFSHSGCFFFHLFPYINLLPASSVHKTNTRRGNVRFLPGSTSSCVCFRRLGSVRASSTTTHSLLNLTLPLNWESKRSYVGICGAFTPELQLDSDSDPSIFV